MPFLQDYECKLGHRFEHLHGGSRETAPTHVICAKCKRKADPFDELTLLCREDWLATPIISTATAPITINRHNGDYAAREKERLTKRSKEHNRLKTSREEADANTERVVGKDTANVLFSKGLHA